MSKPTLFGKSLRTLAIVLFGLTVVFSLLGGAGTTCVALGAEKYSSMAALAPFKWLYQLLAALTIGASLYGVKALVDLLKSRKAAFKEALVALVACLVLALVQVIASRILRGKSMPNDMRVYISFITLLVFGVLRLPPVWSQSGMGQPGGGSGMLAAGLSLLLSGVTILTVQQWAGPTHTWEGTNFADQWHTQLAVLGWSLALVSLLPFGFSIKQSRVSGIEGSGLTGRTRITVG